MTDDPTRDVPERRVRRRRSDGERSRNAILGEAARLATVEGIAGLSIGRLADAVGMSKSGLFAHFGSKEELQLATIEAAKGTFGALVLEPGLAAPAGLERLRTLTDAYLSYLESDVYPGGCFFASVMAEMDMQEGPVRDVSLEVLRGWLALLEATVREAQAAGDIDPAEDPGQLVFEIEALLLFAKAQFVVTRTSLPIERARNAIARRIAA
jgi:AcrR family transcriptional regulator